MREYASVTQIQLTAQRVARTRPPSVAPNEKIQQAALDYDVDGRLPFICECSEPGCVDIVRLGPADYRVGQRPDTSSPRRATIARQMGGPTWSSGAMAVDLREGRRCASASRKSSIRDHVIDERERRLGLNEALFREVNERLGGLNEAFGEVTNRMELVCECADPGCAEANHVTVR